MLPLLSLLAALHLGAALAPSATLRLDPPAKVKVKKKQPSSPAVPAPSEPTAPTPPTTVPAVGELSRTWNVCGGQTASLMCASIQVSVVGTTTTLRVRNVSGELDFVDGGLASAGQWILTSVGIDGVAAAAGTFTVGGSATVGSWWGASAPASWARFDDVQHGGGVNVDFGIDNGGGIAAGIASSCAEPATLPGGSNAFWMTAVEGCDGFALRGDRVDGGWMETRVTTAQAWDPTGDGVSVFFKGQNGPGGMSYECVVGSAPRGDCVEFDPTGAQGVAPGSVVPEPRTVVLTATGLLAILGPAIRRRFRRR